MDNPELSISKNVRDYITEVHQNDSKYFETVSVDNRLKDFSIFCLKYPEKGIVYANHKNMLITQLRKMAPKLKIDLTKLGIKSPTDIHKINKGGQQGTIKINPKNVKNIPNPQENLYDSKTGKLIQQPQPTAQPQQTVYDTKTGLPIPQQQQGQIQHPPNCQCFKCLQTQGIYQEMDNETAGAPFEVLADIWNAKNPKFRKLDKSEVNRLGKAWAPIFSRYIGGDIMLFLLPVVVTAQCFMGRAMETRTETKDNTEKKRDKANKETSGHEKQKRDYSDESAENSNDTQVKRKFFSSKKIDEIIKEGKDDD